MSADRPATRLEFPESVFISYHGKISIHLSSPVAPTYRGLALSTTGKHHAEENPRSLVPIDSDSRLFSPAHRFPPSPNSSPEAIRWLGRWPPIHPKYLRPLLDRFSTNTSSEVRCVLCLSDMIRDIIQPCIREIAPKNRASCSFSEFFCWKSPVTVWFNRSCSSPSRKKTCYLKRDQLPPPLVHHASYTSDVSAAQDRVDGNQGIIEVRHYLRSVSQDVQVLDFLVVFHLMDRTVDRHGVGWDRKRNKTISVPKAIVDRANGAWAQADLAEIGMVVVHRERAAFCLGNETMKNLSLTSSGKTICCQTTSP